MACNISTGRNEVCKDSVGGLQGVYFINYTTGSFATNGSGEITSLSGSTAYYYELKGNTSQYTETVNTSRDNGTTFFNQELVVGLKKLTNEMTTTLKVLSYGRPQVIVWTMNGDALLVGQKEGADLTAGTINTGGAMGDLYGYSLTFTGQEKLPAAFISGSTTTNAFAGLGANAPTIVYGTNS